MAKRKLDFSEQREWQNCQKGRTPQNMPKLEEFITFLTQRCHTLRMLNQNKAKMQKQPIQRGEKKHEKRVSLATTTATCKICSEDHPTYRCEQLQKLTPEKRRETVIEKRLCVNCLNSGHLARECRSSNCKKCGERHNTILHEENRQGKAKSGLTTEATTNTTNSNTSAGVFYMSRPESQVILSTAEVYVHDSNGELIPCRVLLDQGSQINIMTLALARRLRLSSSDEVKSISSLNQNKSESKKTTSVKIQAKNGDFIADIECVLLPSITEELPQKKINIIML